jgi:ubiquinone/menaquinone biosynthesis C-methylase UbiE
VLEDWLAEATEAMLDLAELRAGARVLDVAAGAGGQTLAAARRVGPQGSVLATDISENILAFAETTAREAGLANVTTQVMDGESLEVPDGSFDAVISRVGFIYFPDQHAAFVGMRRALRPVVVWLGLSTRRQRRTGSSQSRSRSSAGGPRFHP